MVAGGRCWDEKFDNTHQPYTRPLTLSESYETLVEKMNGGLGWELNSETVEVRRCFATAVAINSECSVQVNRLDVNKCLLILNTLSNRILTPACEFILNRSVCGGRETVR